MSYIAPLVAVLISVTVLGESMTLLQAVGGAMILGFTLIDSVNLKRKIKSTKVDKNSVS